MAKKLIGIRISDATAKQIEELKKTGRTQTEIVSIAIDRMARENTMYIKVRYSEDSLWGDLNPEEYDTEESKANYQKLVAANIKKQWPNADFTVECDICDSHTVETDGVPDDDATEILGGIIHETWESFDWAVEAE